MKRKYGVYHHTSDLGIGRDACACMHECIFYHVQFYLRLTRASFFAVAFDMHIYTYTKAPCMLI